MPRSPRVQSSFSDQKIPGGRACDQCRASKTKCEGLPGQICKHCAKSGTLARECTYNDPPKAKGPKPGSKALNGSGVNRHVRRRSQHTENDHDPALHQREAHLLTPELVHICFDFYRDHVQSVLPLLDSYRLSQALAELTNDEAYVQLCAFCAYVCLLPTFSITDERVFTPRQRAAGGGLGDNLFAEARKIRRNLILPDQVTSATISTCLLLSESYRLLEDHDSAQIFTHEATNWSANKLHWPSQVQSSTDRLIYYTLYIHERLWALQSKSRITFSPRPVASSITETHIDGNSLVAFNRRLEILQDFDLSSGVEAATSYDSNEWDGSAHLLRLPEQYRTPFLIAVRHYLDIGDQGDWVLDFKPATTWLEKGLNLVVENHDTIIIPSPTNKPWHMQARDLTGTVNALMRILSIDSVTSSAVTNLREWVRPIWQRLNAGSPDNQQRYMPYASPTSHMGQVANYVSPTIHGSIPPVHSTPVAQCPPSPYPSRNSSFDAAVPVHGRYVPTANLTYQSPMVPMYASLVGPSMETSPSYGYHHSYGSGLGMGSAPS